MGKKRTKSSVQSDIDKLESLKREYEGVKHTLESLLEELITENKNIKEESYDPLVQYQLAGESSEDWKGVNYSLAQEKRSQISTALSGYEGEIGKLSSEITEAINELEEKISEISNNLSDLYEELKNAPDDEDGEEDGEDHGSEE